MCMERNIERIDNMDSGSQIQTRYRNYFIVLRNLLTILGD